MDERGPKSHVLVDEKTSRDLGYHDVVCVISGLTTFAPAAAAAERMKPLEDQKERERVSALVGEITALARDRAGEDDGTDPFIDFSMMEDPSALTDRLGKGGVLSGEELLKLERFIPAFLRLRRLCEDRDGIPNLKKMVAAACDDASIIEQLEDFSIELTAVLDEDGTIKDSATSELRAGRKKLRGLRSAITEKVSGLMERFGELLQDSYYTIREGRYVLPVRSEARANIRGIIHGHSSSGATTFIEPEGLVDDGNRIKIIEGEIRAEEERILRELTERLAGHTGTLEAIAKLFASYDHLCAMARFGRETGGRLPELSAEPRLSLVEARHPLLLLSGADVVPNSVELGSGQGWVISGPNAGGKTILLKTVGLCLLMAYSGIPIPVEDHSVVGAFQTIRSVIGDDQSVARNLSTFSAQIRNIADVLRTASDRSFVLLDELATGTEPHEGAALAREILLELVDGIGATVMVATHFEHLKKLSICHEKFTAAGMGFDFDALSPTFRVNLGIPGISGGLVVAGKYGLDNSIIERARKELEGGGNKLSLQVEEIEKMKSVLQKELEEIEEKKKEIKGREAEIEGMKKHLLEKRRKELTAQQAYLTSELKLLHSELKFAHKVIRRRPVSTSALKSTAHTAGKVSKLLAPEGRLTSLIMERDKEGLEPADAAGLEIGRKVFVKKLGIYGSFDGFEGKRVRIRCEDKTIIVSQKDIFLSEGKKSMKDEDEKGKKTPGSGVPDDADDVQSSYNTLDVRGMALDEARMEADNFIDNTMEMGLGTVYIIHGHGTGILKNGLRRHLRHLKTVEHFRPGGRAEGGDGCTVVKIKG
ncbi:MAG: Smr/MutS family protein [Pseudomonadota bacterium]